MNIAEIMHEDLITAELDDSLSLALRKLKDKKIKHLPVLGRDGALAGIVSDRDLKRASPSDATLLEVHELLYLLDQVKLSEVMTKSPVVATPEMSIEGAAKLMVDGKIGCLPVMAGKKLVGIVTHSDLLGYLIGLATA